MPFALDRRILTRVALAALGASLIASLPIAFGYGVQFLTSAAVIVIGAGIAYLLWNAHPTWTLSSAILLTPFSGYWDQLGLPGGYVAPDRILLIGGLAAIALRGPFMRERPSLRPAAVHWAMLVLVVYASLSAAISGSVGRQADALKLVEAFGILPFLAFLFAPMAFRTEQQRRVLLGFLVTLGGYLGLTALFEALDLRALVWPGYINDVTLGIHSDRARGPFLEAVTLGMALFVTGSAAAIAMATWHSRLARRLAAGVVVLCAAGILFALERSGWVAHAAAILVVVIATRELRPRLVPILVGALVIVTTAFAVVPGLYQRVSDRVGDQQSIYDRRNLTTAALNMVEARPLVGFGWGEFRSKSSQYFEQADFPLTAGNVEIHNVPLTYAANLGLVGLTLWLLVLVLGIGGALATRGPPSLRPWRIAFLGIAVYFLVISSFVPPQVFPNLALWLWAGIVWSGRLPQPADGA